MSLEIGYVAAHDLVGIVAYSTHWPNREFVIVNLCVELIGFVAGLAAAIYLLSDKVNRSTPISIILHITLCLLDSSKALIDVIVNSYNLHLGGFAVGKYGCLIQAAYLHFSIGSSLACCTALSLSRYLIICKGVAVTTKMVFQGFLILFPLFLLYGIVPTFIPNVFAVQQSRLMCTLRWYVNTHI